MSEPGIQSGFKHGYPSEGNKAETKTMLSDGTRSVNRELEEKAQALAWIRGYVTNLAACPDGTPRSPPSS